jgi:Holliday junction resolvase RusA-like endonuclease
MSPGLFQTPVPIVGEVITVRTLKLIVTADPMGAVRQTRADRWRKRPCVLEYEAYREVVREQVVKQSGGELPSVPDGANMVFTIMMPHSWSDKKKGRMCGQPHRQRPDKDNLEKAILDALFAEDGAVWKGSQKKVWGRFGQVEIEFTYEG